MNKKIVLVIIIVLVLFSVLLFFILSKKDDKKPDSNNIDYNNGSYIVIDNVSSIIYSNNKYFNCSSEFIEGKLFNTYVDNNYYGKYNLKHGFVWNLFADNKYIGYKGKLFAYSDSLNLVLKNFKKTTISETELIEIKNILGYSYNSSLSTNEVINIDLDNNGLIDKIVNVSNTMVKDNSINSYFSLIYIVLNNNLNVFINSKIPLNTNLGAPNYSINNIWSINNSKYLTIDLLRDYYSEVGNTVNVLLEYDNNEYRIVFEG